MKKFISVVMIAVLMTASSFKGIEGNGNYVLVTNESYNAISVEIYYDYRDGGGYTWIQTMHIPGQYTKSFSIQRGQLYRYAYTHNKDDRMFRVMSDHLRIY